MAKFQPNFVYACHAKLVQNAQEHQAF
jgi:hypothetical protein